MKAEIPLKSAPTGPRGYAAFSYGGVVATFDRNPTTGSLTLLHELHTADFDFRAAPAHVFAGTNSNSIAGARASRWASGSDARARRPAHCRRMRTNSSSVDCGSWN